MSVQRCTTAAFALVELFDHWIVAMDCYFRPCVHELKQACEILLYHVDQNTPIKRKALEGLMRLIGVLLKTPVGEIARTRPFVQRVLKAIQQNNIGDGGVEVIDLLVAKANVVVLDCYCDMGCMICKVEVCALNVVAEVGEVVGVNCDVVLLDVMVHLVSMLHWEHCEPTILHISSSGY
ncbi:hypothetical protein G6F42_021111 [Rhizopus arrhizus]|nr:hypothetical protein G6F42_021111 [Rhizopus arrhizus]